MWAEASNVLQYKREDTVPTSIRRALSRGSAILETLDLEFDRVLSERDVYRTRVDVAKSSEALNVDLLEKTLDSLFPAENKSADESYAELLSELSHFGVTTATGLTGLVAKHIDAAMRDDQERVASARARLAKNEPPLGTSAERAGRGVYFTHTGLGRVVLGREFGDSALIKFWDKKRSGQVNEPLGPTPRPRRRRAGKQ
jgi:putative GTP pyrophosphokinase